MIIAAGQQAPTFEARTHEGEPISLEQFKGKKVWLAFYRYASCPLCNLRVSEIIKDYAAVENAGIQKVAVFQSPTGSIDIGVGSQHPPFPIIADPNLELYAQYGVTARYTGMFYPRVMLRAVKAMAAGLFSLRMEGPIATVPADFFIDPEGLVWDAYYGKAVSDHVSMDRVRAFGEDLCLDMPAAPAA